MAVVCLMVCGLMDLSSRDGCEAEAVRTWLRSIQWMPWRVIAWPSRLRKTGCSGKRLRVRASSAVDSDWPEWTTTCLVALAP